MKKGNFIFIILLTYIGGCTSSKMTSGQIGGYNYIDLGLTSGTLWATCNVGASETTEFGNYFAWGETTSKKTYNWATYKYSFLDTIDSVHKFTKYCDDNSYGFVDNKKELDSEDDVATVNWGAQWRIPTKEEACELISECEWRWEDNYKNKGIAGALGKSRKNGNYIFLPAAGWSYDTIQRREVNDFGDYWISSIDDTSSYYANSFCFDEYSFKTRILDKKFIVTSLNRIMGQSVRAVKK